MPAIVNDAYIIGNNKIGSMLEVSLLNPTEEVVEYQWLRSSIYNGAYENIENATEKTYTISLSDMYVKCKVTISGESIYSNIVVVDRLVGTEDDALQVTRISNIGCGLSYSNMISKVSGLSNIVYDLSRINQSIYIILNTALGEVPMIPTLGCRIHEMIFEGATEQNIDAIRLEVENALTTQEPRINILNVSCEYDGIHTVHVIVDYAVKNTNIKSQYIYDIKEGENSFE